ncbi:MAG TPA: hypothetical protein VJ553_04975, partial [Candidatus Paceibacterota bacterium]|nr:hypothetical protein [Candidatus Paceibacterota bacterium]
GCKCTWCPGVRAVARLLRRYTWSHEKQTMVECDAGGFVLYTDAVKMQAALLSVLRQCVEALERCDKHFQHGAGYVCDAICAARPYIERKEGNPSVTKAVVDR